MLGIGVVAGGWVILGVAGWVAARSLSAGLKEETHADASAEDTGPGV